MSCDLSDPAVSQAYEDIKASEGSIDWFTLGYRETRDKIHLYSRGSDGLDGLVPALSGKEEVHFGMLKMEGKLLLFTYVPESVGGVRRARALVHGRSIGSFFRAHQSTLNVSRADELTVQVVRSKLKLDGSSSIPSSPRIPRSPSTPRSSEFSSHQDKYLNRSNLTPPLGSPGSLSPRRTEFHAPQQLATSSNEPTDIPPVPRPISPPSQSPPLPTKDIDLPYRLHRKNGSNGHPPLALSNPPPRQNGQSLNSPHDSRPTSPNVYPSPSQRTRPLSPREISRAVSPQYSPQQALPGSDSRPISPVESDGSQRESGSGNDALNMIASAQFDKTPEQVEKDRLVEIEERKKRQLAEELARKEAARKEALKVKEEAEQRERMRLDAEERARVDMMEHAKREAAERLRREEQRRAEEEAKRIQEEKNKEEAARRKILEAQERERIRNQEEERKRVLAEEARKRAEARKAEREQLQNRFKDLDPGEVMLTGHVTVQGGNSIMWRRRYFQLRGDSLSLFKNDQDVAKPVDKIDLTNKVKSISDDAEVMIQHSFKLNFKDYDEEPYLFYCDEAEDKDLLVAGIHLASRL